MKKSLFAIMIVIIFAVFFNGTAIGEEMDRKLTLMIYMCGSNLESGYGAASADIEEMKAAGLKGKEVTVLLMTGGTQQWSQGYDASKCLIHELGPRGTRVVWRSDAMNMGEPETLIQLLQFGKEAYPAEDYALILWDHGGGPLEGVCFDENYSLPKGKDSLSLEELEYALSQSSFSENNKIEWIGFDACLMSSIEVANKCASYAKYMIASQEVEPGSGWNYSFLKDIHLLSSGAEVGKRIIETYFDKSSTNQLTNPILTLSCTDLSKINHIQEMMNITFGEINSILDFKSYPDFVRKRLQASSIGRDANNSANYDLVDLLGLLIAYDEESAATRNLQEIIRESVVYNSSSVDGLNGLSIYFPYYNKEYYQSSWNEKYKTLSISAQYSDFLNTYCSIWLSPDNPEWNSNRELFFSVSDSITTLSAELSNDLINDYAFSSLYVLIDLGWNDVTNDKGYLFSTKSNDVHLIGNTLTANDPKEVLVFCDSEGSIIAKAIEYEIVDDVYIIPVQLNNITLVQALNNISNKKSGIEEEEFITVEANLKCSPPDSEGMMEIICISPLSEGFEDFSLGKVDFQLSDFAEIGTVQDARHPTYSQDGLLLPFDQWERMGYAGYLIDLSEYNYDIRVRMIHRNEIELDEGSFDNYAYVFTITDTKNNSYSTTIVSID